MRCSALLGAVLFIVPAATVCGDEWPVPRGPANEPLPFTLDAKYLADVPKTFLEDTAACILFTRTTHLIEPDGTVTTIVHEITRFNGRKGVEKLGEYRNIYFNPRYEKLTLNEARVLKADGAKVPVEPRHLQLRDMTTDFQVYDDSKQLVISWPNLQVGDAYEVKWSVRGKNPEFAGEFFTRYNFGDDDFPVVRDELLVRVPQGKPIKYATVNGAVVPTRTQHRGQVQYHWQVKHKEPLPRDDDKPSKEELRWQVALSTFPSWEAVGKWKQSVRKECWECTDAIKQVVAEVAGPQKTPLDKARALTYWVRQNVRYLSRGPEGMGFTPNPPDKVLGNRFGDCKDQAQLLAVMLRAIGLPVWLVTLGTVDDGQVLDEVPSPWGTHAILLVELDGKEYWIDTTVSQAAWDYLPRGDCGRRCYLTRDGQVKLARTPALTHENYRVEQTTQVTIAPNGMSHSKRTISYHGTGAWTKRDAWLDTPLGERRRQVTAELQDANSRTRLVGLKVDEKSLYHYDGPVRAEVEFEIPEHFGGDPREGALSDSVVWSRLLSFTLDPTRELPFELPAPFESVHRFVVKLPPALRTAALPEDKKVHSAWGFLDLKVAQDPADPHRIEMIMRTRLQKTRVEPADFAAFQKFHDDVAKAYRVWFTLHPTHDLADATALEALIAKAPANELYSTKVLAQLYLDHDRRADASRVLAMAVKHHPSEDMLWEMRLQAAREPAEKENLYRAMITQFPREGRYAAALGASLAQRGELADAKKVLLPLAEHATPAVRGLAHYQLARICDREGRWGEALKHLDTAVTADATLLTDVKALDFKARVHEKLGAVNDAIATYQLALELSDKAQELLAPLVRLEWRAARKSDALDHLRRYTVFAGREPVGLVNAAELHLLLGRPDDAAELVERIPDDARSPAAYGVLGRAQLQRKQYAEAIASLKQTDASDERFVALIKAHIALGNLDDAAPANLVMEMVNFPVEPRHIAWAEIRGLRERRHNLLAAGDFGAGEQVKVRRAAGRFVCAEHGLHQGWSRDHIARLTEAALAEMQFGPALALRGWLALERGQLMRALADAEKAIALKPPDARAFLVRGRVRLERGDVRALEDLTQAAQLSERKDAMVLHWLAAAQAQAGQHEAALTTQRAAVQLRPDDMELAEQLRAFERR